MIHYTKKNSFNKEVYFVLHDGLYLKTVFILTGHSSA